MEDIKDENWDNTYKGKLFEQVYNRKCDYSKEDCYKMSILQKTINILVQDMLKGNPEAAKTLLSLVGQQPYLKTSK